MPLVYIALQIQTTSQVTRPDKGRAPVNQFAHFRELPDASDQVVVGLNVDTLYSIADLDLSGGPLVLSVPPMGERYWLMQLIDAWNNVPHVPGTRTIGAGGGHFAITGPDWSGELPEGVEELRMPTNLALLGGRTYVSGPQDYAAAHRLQDQYRLVPLAAWGSDWTPPAEVPLQPGVDARTPVTTQVFAMPPDRFFSRLNDLLATNPVYPEDAPQMERLAALGIGPGAVFPWDDFTPEVQGAITRSVEDAKETVRSAQAHLGENVNGWMVTLDMGRYGTRYPYRAAWTFFGVGGNLIEDACYPLALTDGQGRPLDASHHYRLHFDKEQLPPVDAFWSLTLYDPDSYLVANPANRYALGDRTGLDYGDDGSLTLTIQAHEPTGGSANWLPTPTEGAFKVALRLYSPKPEVAQGTWEPPAIERLD
ncbi:DUF1254 domain-containing protein [Kitasatospora sp. NBC_00070]|uniref:DUF1254 domain-containing protein n=1 Tax=Kitasatospora sp. NBC_00070 TaxID=2975962 RepID=UPI003247E398